MFFWSKSCVGILGEIERAIAVFASSERQKPDFRLPLGIFRVAIAKLSRREREEIEVRKTMYRGAKDGFSQRGMWGVGC